VSLTVSLTPSLLPYSFPSIFVRVLLSCPPVTSAIVAQELATNTASVSSGDSRTETSRNTAPLRRRHSSGLESVPERCASIRYSVSSGRASFASSSQRVAKVRRGRARHVDLAGDREARIVRRLHLVHVSSSTIEHHSPS